jgi:MFS family permease
MHPITDVKERFQQAKGFPWRFWVLFAGTLITSLGGAIILPFLTLFFTDENIVNPPLPMTQIGLLITLFALCGILSQFIGGYFLDRVGRKIMMVLSLFLSAAAMYGFGFVKSFAWAVPLTLFSGLFGPIFGLASNTVIADMFQSERRMRAYGLLRIASNIGVGIGPALGGFLVAAGSYRMLFNTSAALILFFGLLALILLQETKPNYAQSASESDEPKHFGDLFGAFKSVFRDRYFMIFCWVSVLALTVYAQMGTTFPIYIRDAYQITPQKFGFMMSLNALMIVLFQYLITRMTENRSKTLMMALGALLFAFGFGSVAFFRSFEWLFLSVAIWTLGEMILTPVSTAFVADLASEEKRGRYMGVFGLAWAMGYAIGPMLGGIFIDFRGGQYAIDLWYATFVVATLAAIGYGLLGRWTIAQDK